MYAHLYFDSGTAVGEIVRDIVRLITSCTSTTASLAGLEFINTGSSTVVGGNSGWSLNASSPAIPSSGTAVSTNDSNFILEATCTDVSKTKYCGIHVNADWTNSSIVTGSAASFTISSVIDPGTATELWSNGYTGTGATIYDTHGIVGDAVHSINGIHIFADSTRILMHGIDGNNDTIFMGAAEFAETSTTTHQSLVPQCNFLVNEMRRADVNENTSYRGDGTALWDDVTVTYSFFQLLEATYSYNPAWLGKVRYAGWHEDVDTLVEQIGGAYRFSARLDDGTTEGSITDYITAGLGRQQNAGMLQHASTLSLFGTNVMVNNYNASATIDSLWGRSSALAYDSSGSVGLAIRKIFWEVEPNWNNDVLDISGVSNFWRCAAGLGSDGDTITIGSDVYVYLNMYPSIPTTLGAFLVKRT